MTQWHVTYPELQIIAADMTHSSGVSPSVCHVTATPLSTDLPKGDLVFYEDGVPILTFTDCAAARSITCRSMARRGIRVTVDILDRRWKWRYSTISGKYNVRDSAGNIIADTEKTYEELIEILLDALGESGYEINLPGIMPDAPEIHWDDARIDLELAHLVEFIGCIIHLGFDNLVHIFVIGEGPIYPLDERTLIPILDFTPQHYPESVEVVCGPTVYQEDIVLEAVGLDYDGSIKLLKDLEYAHLVASDWDPLYLPGSTGVAPFAGTQTITGYRSIAMASVYRMYRIKDFGGAALTLEDGNTISSIENILPLLPRIVTIDTDTMGHDVGPRPYVWGTWLDPFTGKSIEATYNAEFHLDLERGIVIFHDYVYDTDGTGITAATLNLVASFHARKEPTSGRYRNSYSRAVTHGSEETAYVRRDDLYLVRVDGQSTEATVAANGGYAAQAAVKLYEGVPQGSAKIVGVKVWPLAGNISQVRWVVNAAEVVTYGGKSLEYPVAGPLYSERRIREIISDEVPLC